MHFSGVPYRVFSTDIATLNMNSSAQSGNTDIAHIAIVMTDCMVDITPFQASHTSFFFEVANLFPGATHVSLTELLSTVYDAGKQFRPFFGELVRAVGRLHEDARGAGALDHGPGKGKQ